MTPPDNLKRKRNTTTTQHPTASKHRRNTISSSSDAEGPVATRAQKRRAKEPEKKAERILEEDGSRYRVKWVVDPRTTEELTHDWIPKEDASRELVAAWEESTTAPRKRGRPRKELEQTAPKRGRPRKELEQTAPKRGRPRKEATQSTEKSPAPPPRRRGRPRKAVTDPVASNPQTSRVTKRSAPPASPPETSPSDTPQLIATALISQNTSLATPSPRPGLPAIGVLVAPRPSFNPQDFERFSELPPTLSSLQEAVSWSVKDTEPSSSPLNTSPTRSFVASGIVPNSQSSSGSTSYVQASSSNQQHSSNNSVSYVSTVQNASASNHQQSSNESASCVSTTQDASGSDQQYTANSTASYVPTTQKASRSGLDGSTGLEEQEIQLDSPASVAETNLIESTQNSSQPFIQSRVEEREIPDTFGTTEGSTRPVRQSVSGSAIQHYIAEQSPPLRTESPSPSVLQVIEESEFIDSIIETEPPSLQQLQQSVDDSEVHDSIVGNSSPFPKEVPGSAEEVQDTIEELPIQLETARSVSPRTSQSRHQEEDQQISFAQSARPSEADNHIVVTSSSQVIQDTVAQAHHMLQGVLHDNVNHRDFAVGSQNSGTGTSSENSESLVGQSPSQRRSAAPPTQHAAQIVPPDLYLSTPDNSADSVRLTTEIADHQRAETLDSRHGLSQQSPSPLQLSASVVDYSAPPRPPTHSYGTLDSNAPPRLQTPVDISAPLTGSMTDRDSIKKAEMEENIKKAMADIFQQNREKRPFTPKKRELKLTTMSTAAGTRSPSTIPDRSPPQQLPTSLRMTALASEFDTSAPVPSSIDIPHAPPAPSPSPMVTSAASPAPSPSPMVTSAAPPTPPSVQVPASTSALAPISVRTPVFSPAPAPAPASAAPSLASVPMDTDDVSDDDSESLLNDDLGLMPEEHIVPLAMEGRQRSLYVHELKRDEEMIRAFMNNPQDFDDMSKVQTVIEKLKAIETHMDLIYAEAAQTAHATDSSTQAQWDMESVKFRFLGQLFRSLQYHEMNIIVVIEKDNEQLFKILEKFCKGKFINFRTPVNCRHAHPDDVEGDLTVTLLASNSSPVVRPPSAIICLDGTVNEAQIRKHNWSNNPDRQTVPIIHLVIPRSIGHVERYVSSALGSKKRLHTIFCSLAQVYSSIGHPMVVSPSAREAAELVAKYLISLDLEDADEWPLPSVGSIKDVIEYQSQQSQDSISSPLPTITTSKRPLDDEHLDSAKRMRMTPQPQPASGTDNEITHISDSMPGTAVHASKLQEQLNEKQRALEKAKAELKAHNKRFREHQVTWDKRQTEFEDLHKNHRVLLGEIETCKKSLETSVKQKENAKERFNKKAAEFEELRTLYNQLQTTNLASDDNNVVEIARLRKELAESKEAEARAVSKAASIENTLEYTKEQYRNAQDSATEFKEANDTLTAELAIANKKASGEVAKLKKLHLDRSFDEVVKQRDSLRTEKSTLEKVLQLKEEEIARLKSAKDVRMNTRGQSAGPKTPRPGSRAASPTSFRNRVSNLRND
ncbi:hypothetical protein K505DRAFT_365297 [Melanomma pulvis-pyrius CBS 109.77]|uniref:Chromo domain-containing protein n=1 Tax=Melanomma pulvis-pyrius CBS 109.77 TaxID=1314802 RepID=A0A6A6X0A9_9PLEO|nr:hypothetical protein K505DRAFT_365297 [Melanomma pulvis-pyrius CBS 109.77]